VASDTSVEPAAAPRGAGRLVPSWRRGSAATGFAPTSSPASSSGASSRPRQSRTRRSPGCRRSRAWSPRRARW